MNVLLRAIGAEFLKVLTTRTWWVLAIVMAAYVALLAGGLGGLFGYISAHPEAARGGSGGGLPPGTAVQQLIYGFATTIGYVFPVLLGALATTGEFRHQTLTPTFLATPRRGLVLLAKVKVFFLVGAVFGVIAWAASLTAGGLVLGAVGLESQLGHPDVWAEAGRGILAMALWSAIGVGLGALVRSQVAAIVIVLAFTQFVEPLLRLAAGFIDATAAIGRFLPGAASDALVGSSFYSIAGTGGGASDPLSWWAGALVLLAYAVLFTVAGYFTSWRRDVS
ncbi:ABC transporter permease [Rathayibacter sp. YIM 133350]|uniref:ABC transporter permease n=1 Tax=Rathayibacter sp. YIM 133350 TaxID=3131992 RepID=UPI00307CE8C9